MLLGVGAAARQLAIGQSTVRRWIREGRIPIVRLGRRVLLRRETLVELIQRSQHPALTGPDRQPPHGGPRQ